MCIWLPLHKCWKQIESRKTILSKLMNKSSILVSDLIFFSPCIFCLYFHLDSIQNFKYFLLKILFKATGNLQNASGKPGSPSPCAVYWEGERTAGQFLKVIENPCSLWFSSITALWIQVNVQHTKSNGLNHLPQPHCIQN